MLHLLAAFLSGAALRSIVDAYGSRRRLDRSEAWERIKEGATGTRTRLSEVLRQQGVYDEPEMH